MKVKVVLNPYANRWGARDRYHQIEAALTAVSITPDIVVTEKPEHGIELAYEAVKNGYDRVVAAGGDGTINEVINGLIQASFDAASFDDPFGDTLSDDRATIPFGIFPIGTANDFSDLAGFPRDLDACAAIIASGKTRQVDAGRVNERYFINNCAVAMEPMVTIENIRMTRFSGTLRYLIALVRALIKLQAWQMEISWDGGGYTGPAYLLSVCNGPRTGGFYMAPDALIDDGLFDFVFAPEVPKRTVIAVLLRLFAKTHIFHPVVTYGKSKQLSLTSVPGTPIHADGELFTEAETAVSFELLPGKVTLLGK